MFLWSGKDERLPKKHRHNSTTLHAALKVLGYDGSHGRVAAYIRERSRLAGTPSSAVFSPLRFAPSEAFQFDFGTETVELDISSYRMNFPPSL